MPAQVLLGLILLTTHALASDDSDGRLFRLFAQADYGVGSMSENPNTDFAGNDLKEHLGDQRNGSTWNVLAGVLKGSGHYGLGILFQKSGYEAELQSLTYSMVGEQTARIDEMESVVSRTLIAGLLLIRHPFGERLCWSTQFGIGNMQEQVEVEMSGSQSWFSSSPNSDFSAEGSLESSGLAFIFGTGLDYYLTENIAVGCILQYVASGVKVDKNTVWVETDETQSKFSSSDAKSSDASHMSFGGGLRFLY